MKIQILESVLEMMPKKWVTYLGAGLMAVTGLIQAEASLGEELSLFDVPQSATNTMAMISTAIIAVGLRRGQQKSEDAAKESVALAAQMPAKDLAALNPKWGNPNPPPAVDLSVIREKEGQ